MGTPRLYGDLAAWFPLLTAPASYEEEAGVFRHALDASAHREVREVLELGCGGGHNASWLKRWYTLTLTDLSPDMVALSRTLNPECDHATGDMRTLRLERDFDAVFVHDAVAYMTTEDDLRAAMATAYAHCRPGGVALFVPDDTTESYRPYTKHGGHDGEGRALRYLEWSYDPDPTDTTCLSVMAYLLKEGDAVRTLQDEHELGLFPRETWLRLLDATGFRPTTLPYRHSELDPETTCELFVGRRPG